MVTRASKTVLNLTNPVISDIVVDGSGASRIDDVPIGTVTPNVGYFTNIYADNIPDGDILTDAPSDNSLYARKNGAWTTVTMPDVPEPPPASVPTGATMVFYQTSVPEGWVLDTTVHDKVLRVVNTVQDATKSGGDWTLSGLNIEIDGHSLSEDQMPTHTHQVAWTGLDFSVDGGAFHHISGIIDWVTEGSTPTGAKATSTTEPKGKGKPHTHGATLNADDSWRPAYTNVIICRKS